MKISFAIILALLSLAYAQCPTYQFVVFADTAKKTKGLTKVVNNYRAALGGDDNGSAPGPIENGHRSINWDAPIVPFDMPGNFFDKEVTRGATFKAKGGKFAVSNPEPPNGDDRFSSLLPKAQSKRFKTFSPLRLFTPVKSNKVTVTFKVPATDIPSQVTGFGAVFTDVDLAKRTTMTYFDKAGCKIATVPVLPKSKGLSFAGITVLKPGTTSLNKVIAKVVIKLGNISVAEFNEKYHGTAPGDVVVLDDLIYGEP